MTQKLLTIATLPFAKAQILKTLLEKRESTQSSMTSTCPKGPLRWQYGFRSGKKNWKKPFPFLRSSWGNREPNILR